MVDPDPSQSNLGSKFKFNVFWQLARYWLDQVPDASFGQARGGLTPEKSCARPQMPQLSFFFTEEITGFSLSIFVPFVQIIYMVPHSFCFRGPGEEEESAGEEMVRRLRSLPIVNTLPGSLGGGFFCLSVFVSIRNLQLVKYCVLYLVCTVLVGTLQT